MEASKKNFATIYAIGGYATCSSLMLIVNKLAGHLLPVPSFVLLAQAYIREATLLLHSLQRPPRIAHVLMCPSDTARALRAALGRAILST